MKRSVISLAIAGVVVVVDTVLHLNDLEEDTDNDKHTILVLASGGAGSFPGRLHV
jgi:1,4-dihydroxy-2-naphthoate octaprenyltransferase